MKFSPLRFVGQVLMRHLSRPSQHGVRGATCSPKVLASSIKKGDVLLVEGINRFSVAIKYLSQSTWSHAALCVSEATKEDPEPRLIEARVESGVIISPLSIYYERHTRLCRPVGLTGENIEAVLAYAKESLGDQYDVKNIVDLARYLIQHPPVPTQWRRRLLSLGSGDPTKAICSSLVAQAFHSIGYPILPETAYQTGSSREFYMIRHHSLFVPGDFDLSPYFEVVKPTIDSDFDYRDLPITCELGED